MEGPRSENPKGRFYLDGDLSGEGAFLPGGEARHAFKSKRLVPGDWVELFDGRGGARRGIIEGADYIRFLEPIHVQAVSPHRVTVAVSPPKGDRMHFMVEKLSELGADTIIPTVFHRSVDAGVREGTSKLSKWRRTAVESAKQCGRNRLLEVEAPCSWKDLLHRAGGVDSRIMLSIGGAAMPLADALRESPSPRESLILVGPEGGILEEEEAKALEAGFVRAHLGKHILRTETAAIAATALIRAIWS